MATDYRKLSVAYRSSWHSAGDRESARQTLEGSVSQARAAVQSLQDTRDPELRPLVSKLIVQVELADDACKHPNTLKL